MLEMTVGSLERTKLAACDRAIKTLRLQTAFDGMEVDADQDRQPIGLVATRRGAFTRASTVIKARPRRIAIGIESGIVIEGDEAFDFAFVEILRQGSKRITTTSSMFPIPMHFVRAAQAHGFAVATVGEMIARKLGGDPHDPHKTLSDGRVSRTKLIALAIMQGLEQALQ